MNPVAILLFILVVVVLRALDQRKKQSGPLPPVAQPSWPRVPQREPAPKSASDRPYVQDEDRHQQPAREVVVPPARPVARPAPAPARVEPRQRPDRSPHEIIERELTTAGETDAPAGSALARLQASIEERRLALERRHAKGVSIRSADRGSSQ